MQSLMTFYSYEHSVIRIKQIRNDIKKASQSVFTFEERKRIKRKNFCSIHLAILRQLCGVSFIVVYAGQTLREINSSYAPYSSVLINSVQLASALIGIIFVQIFRR